MRRSMPRLRRSVVARANAEMLGSRWWPTPLARPYACLTGNHVAAAEAATACGQELAGTCRQPRQGGGRLAARHNRRPPPPRKSCPALGGTPPPLGTPTPSRAATSMTRHRRLRLPHPRRLGGPVTVVLDPTREHFPASAESRGRCCCPQEGRGFAAVSTSGPPTFHSSPRTEGSRRERYLPRMDTCSGCI
jgi:hypothetical protein